MNNQQFQALAQLMRLREGPARECARLALVEKIPTPDAARATGMQYRAAAAAVRRAREGLILATKAVDPA